MAGLISAKRTPRHRIKSRYTKADSLEDSKEPDHRGAFCSPDTPEIFCNMFLLCKYPEGGKPVINLIPIVYLDAPHFHIYIFYYILSSLLSKVKAESLYSNWSGGIVLSCTDPPGPYSGRLPRQGIAVLPCLFSLLT